ncbi:MlaE family ABC transporter permease [Desulfovibrio inopinatus]|uniref:MlaE family ABC transporter permease n=1 Tax=Desulfovibrio inopinatus TaxID=102109 RepID=UPI000402E693|nr:ABC transporter permease [Desulfovibrio inopinatus]
MTPTPAPSATVSTPTQLTTRVDGDRLVLCFTGDWSIDSELPTSERLESLLKSASSPKTLAFESQGVTSWDTRFLVFCSRAATAAQRAGIDVDTSGLPEGAVRLITLAAKVPPRPGAGREKKHAPLTVRIGDTTLELATSAHNVVVFIGEMTQCALRFLLGRAVYRRSELFAQIRICGYSALPIVSLISTLVGLILAYVSAIQLQTFGAQIYSSTLVGIAMVRVLSAVMAGIIMAGRTGAAFAAELGTMQVNEEIDALRTFGIEPMEFLVLPRMAAMTMMMPVLCLYADFMGMLGGFIVGVLLLGIGPMEYFEFTIQTVPLANFWIGLVHSFVFGILVSMSGCYQGIRCGRSASAVGKATTSAVVSSIVSIIVATSILTILFNILGY